ncbi:MAG TPA: glycosyltransferase family A protein [Gaiellaceae bacterium]|jgi:hypothetical protein|nr:glycosyltransferase family A protein [Gaiellaceae bacterium]
MTAQRILCYAPYNKWALHGQWEMTILHAARQRGADVRYVLCDGLYSDCDVYWDATEPRPANACELCRFHVTHLVNQLGMEHEWLGRNLLPEERAEAHAWAGGLAVDELRHAAYGDWAIGDWVASSVHSHFRRSVLDLSDPAVERAMRSYLSSGLIAAFALSRLLDTAQPDLLFLFNGRQSSTRIAYELGRRKGIRVVCHERGQLKETIRLHENATCTALEPLRALWRDWADVPLSQRELRVTQDYLRNRALGRNLGWKRYNPPPQRREELYARVGLDPSRPVWGLYTSSDDESAAEVDYRGPFERQVDWIADSIAWAGRHPELDLVVRVHPNTAGRNSNGRNERQLQELRDLAADVPTNVRFVWPDDEVSTYSLMDAAEVGLVYHSTVALELACKGKEVLVAGSNFVGETAFVRTVEAREEYASDLDALLADRRDPVEIRRLGYRFAYRYWLCNNLPFPHVRMPDPHTGVVQWTSVEELAPGRSPELDRIVRVVLDGEPVIPPPTESERARDDAHETAWHAAGDGPRVSVVIPCYGYAHLLGEAVESVLAQTYRDFEIVVVDDGSPDDTAAVAEALIAAHPEHRISLLRRPNSGQPAVARNTGIARARGELIVCLDADDLLEPEFLERCVDALDRHPELSIAYGGQRDFSEDREWPLHPHPPYDFATLAHTNLLGTASMFRREAWEAVGGYPTDVPGYEDWAFWIALGAHGHYAAHVPEAVFRYRVKPGGMADHGTDRDAAHKARIVLANPGVYTPLQQQWAEMILAGDPDALAAAGPTGVIPRFTNDPNRPDLRPRPAVAKPNVAVSGTSTTLALAETVVEKPELFAAWSSVAAPDETLVLLAPGADADAATTQVVEAAQRAEVDIEAVDVVLLTAPLAPAELRTLALAADAVLTSEPAHPDLAILDRRLAA